MRARGRPSPDQRQPESAANARSIRARIQLGVYGRERCRLEPLEQRRPAREPVPGGDSGEGKILLASCHELRDEQVVDFEAPARRTSRGGSVRGDEAVGPAGRGRRRRLVDALGVVAEGLVEGAHLPGRSVDRVPSLRTVPRVHVGLDGNQQLRGCILELAEYRLASDDHDVVVVGHSRGGSDQVFELLSRHVRPRVGGALPPGCGAVPPDPVSR